MGLSGLLINILRILLLITIPNNLTKNAELFFYTSAGFLAICAVLAYRFVKDYEDKFQNKNQVFDAKAFRSEALEIYKINWKAANGVVLLCAV